MRKVWMCAVLLVGGMMLAPIAPTYAGETGQKAAKNYTMVYGKVTAVDAANSSITLSLKEGGSQSFTIPAGVQVKVNGQDGSLADISTGMFGGVKVENGVVVRVKANSRGAKKNKG